MKNPILVDLQLTIRFETGIPLSEFEKLPPPLKTKGVYCIREGECLAEEFNPMSKCVKYIGKAIGETIASRCQKHFWTMTNAVNSNGKPKTHPGVRFKQYREARQFNLDGLYVYAATMTDIPGYLVSCAEEFLLHNYKIENNDIPEANTKS